MEVVDIALGYCRSRQLDTAENELLLFMVLQLSESCIEGDTLKMKVRMCVSFRKRNTSTEAHF